MNNIAYFIYLFLSLTSFFALNVFADTTNNNVCSNAETISLNYNGTGTLSSSDKSDFFQFTLPSSGTLTITVSGATRDLDAYLYQNCSTLLAQDESNSNNPSITYTYTSNSSTTMQLLLYFFPDRQSSNYTITVTFVPNVIIPSFSIADTTLNEGSSGIYTKNIPVTLADANGSTFTINYATSNGTAISGSDYNATSGILTFSGSTTTQNIPIQINGDTTTENDENFFITLSNATGGATISDNSATIKLQNDDGGVGHVGEREFILRNPITTQNIKGGLQVIGNTVLCVQNNGFCYDYTGNSSNAQLDLRYIDVDGITRTYNNSSQAQLNIPTTATIKWAALYTQGYLNIYNSSTVSTALQDPVYLMVPSIGTIGVIPEVIDLYANSTDGYTYDTFAPITALIGQTGAAVNGWITGANIKANTGTEGSGLGNFGAWTLVVIYEDSSSSLKNISVFDGYKRVANADGFRTVNITASGFLTPSSGDVKSTVSIFAGEGDKNIEGDQLYVDGTAINSTNAFYSAMSGFAANPSYSNTQGIDIQNYDIGVDGNASHLQIIGNSQTNSTITLTSTQDTYFPSMVAFTTELYEPRVCYVEAYYDADGNATLTSANIGDIITIKTWIANMKKDASDGNLETAEKVEITMEHDDTNLAYQTNTTKIQNVGENSYINKTDLKDSDIAEYNSDSNTSVWRVGTGATGTDGGNLTPNVTNDATNKAYVSFKSKLLTSGDISIANIYKVSYENSSMGLRIGDESPVNIGVCKDFNSSLQIMQPPLGVFNVTNENANVAAGDPQDGLDVKNALMTQIAGKPFNVKIVALADDKISLENFTGNVILDLVNSTSITDTQSTCTAAPLLQQYKNPTPKTNLFNNESTKNFNLKYDKAHQNSRFRIKFYDFSTIEAIEGQPCSVSNTSANINGVPQCFNDMNKVQKYFPQCATPTTNVCVSNLQGGDDDWKCYECITGYNDPVCSRDNFAIRPERYSIDLNETTLIGGKQYRFDLNATLFGTDNNVSGYNQTITQDLDKNASEGLSLPATCVDLNEDRTRLVTPITFTEGRNQTATYVYNNVGDVTIGMDDNLWTQVDRSLYNTKAFSDCIENSSTNTANASGQIGCQISGGKTFSFLPKKFNNTLTIQNFNNGNFTYISNDGNMSAQLLFSPTAVLEDTITVATNYTANCFARDINYTVALINNPINWLNGLPNATTRIRYFDDSNTSDILNSANGIATFTSSEGNFTNGIATNLKILFNLTRDINKTDEPFKIARNDFNITSVIDQNNTIGRDFNRTNDQNTTFYYGRVYSTDYRDPSPITTTIRYEVYCNSCVQADFNITGTQSPLSLNWYQNTFHANIDGNVTTNGFTSVGTTLINNADTATSGNIANGLENNTLSLPNATPAPYTDRIRMAPSSWLIFNPYNANATTNDFNVEFITSGSWAGQGSLGRTVDVNTSTRTNRRMEW